MQPVITFRHGEDKPSNAFKSFIGSIASKIAAGSLAITPMTPAAAAVVAPLGAINGWYFGEQFLGGGDAFHAITGALAGAGVTAAPTVLAAASVIAARACGRDVQADTGYEAGENAETRRASFIRWMTDKYDSVADLAGQAWDVIDEELDRFRDLSEVAVRTVHDGNVIHWKHVYDEDDNLKGRKIHREDGFAVELADGTKKAMVDGREAVVVVATMENGQTGVSRLMTRAAAHVAIMEGRMGPDAQIAAPTEDHFRSIKENWASDADLVPMVPEVTVRPAARHG